MITFEHWLSIRDKQLWENLWGNIPAKTRKPSDGWTKTSGAGGGMGGQQQQAMPSPDMTKKMKKK